MERTLVSPHPFRTAAPGVWLLATTLGLAVAGAAAAATFQVSNTNDSGPGSLRQAIEDANGALGGDQIKFSIPASGVQTIKVFSQLPNLWEQVSIDGSTQGPVDRHLIVIDGSADPSGVGLIFRARGSVIRHLVVNGFSRTGVGLYGDDHYLADCFIGTDASGEVEVGNAWGVVVRGSGNWIVANTISGNYYYGVDIGGTSNVVENNLIGPDRHGRPFAASGTVSQQVSVFLWGSNNVVRLNTIGATHAGVYLAYANRNQILGNSIGVAADGVTPLGAPSYGILLEGGDGSSFNLVGGNRIGHIGRAQSVQGNAGIWVMEGVGNTLRENLIYDLRWSALAIDLGQLGQDVNDPGDPDKGPNGLQNWPVILDALSDPRGTQIQGELGSTPGTQFTIDLYATTTASTPGRCEARVHLGAVFVTSDASGYARFSLALPSALDAGTRVSATATVTPVRGPGSTSESSPCVAVHN